MVERLSAEARTASLAELSGWSEVSGREAIARTRMRLDETALRFPGELPRGCFGQILVEPLRCVGVVPFVGREPAQVKRGDRARARGWKALAQQPQ